MAGPDPSQASTPEATVPGEPSATLAADAPAPEVPSDTAPTADEAPSFGWNAYAERINGRFAMVGFIALLVLELFLVD
jgi:hypothetical protein